MLPFVKGHRIQITGSSTRLALTGTGPGSGQREQPSLGLETKVWTPMQNISSYKYTLSSPSTTKALSPAFGMRKVTDLGPVLLLLKLSNVVLFYSWSPQVSLKHGRPCLTHRNTSFEIPGYNFIMRIGTRHEERYCGMDMGNNRLSKGKTRERTANIYRRLGPEELLQIWETINCSTTAVDSNELEHEKAQGII